MKNGKNPKICLNLQTSFSRQYEVSGGPKPLKTKKIARSLTSCQNFGPSLRNKNILLGGRLKDIFARIVLIPWDSSKILTRGRRARNSASFDTLKLFVGGFLGPPHPKTRLKNLKNFRPFFAILGAFLGPTGEKRGVHVGFGPKRTYGAKIVKIGVGGRTGGFRPLMFGLLNSLRGALCVLWYLFLCFTE